MNRFIFPFFILIIPSILRFVFFGREQLARHSRTFEDGEIGRFVGFEIEDSATVGKALIPGDIIMNAVGAENALRFFSC